MAGTRTATCAVVVVVWCDVSVCAREAARSASYLPQLAALHAAFGPDSVPDFTN